MSKEKNLPLLIGACREIRRHFPRLRLQLIGDGPVRPGLPSEDWIQMPGMVDDVCPFLTDADCFVLPSSTEGLPMALLEAGMAGLPAVVTRVGEMPSIIEQSDGGWVVEPGDEQALAKVLEDVANLREAVLKTKGNALRKYIEAHYSVQKMTDDYEQVYKVAGAFVRHSLSDGGSSSRVFSGAG